jgi:hypothetical protein
MASKKDDILTLVLPGSDLVFTRYLYIKEEVKIALLVCLLNKSDDTLFWAYELYYSGFKQELIYYIQQIYYEFFYTLNPSFEQYFIKKTKEEVTDSFIGSLIQNLLYRPFNTDVFMLKNICKLFDFETIYADNTKKITNMEKLKLNCKYWVKNDDYRSIANWILNENKNFKLIEIYVIMLNIFEEKENKVFIRDFDNLDYSKDLKLILVARIMGLFTKKHKLKKGRSIYISVKTEEINCYQTIAMEKSYQVLEAACKCGIDDFHYLSLFKLRRAKYDFTKKYRLNWLYHASFSPIWSKRIHRYGGYPDYINQKIIFKEEPDDLMQMFYDLYGYEPDEQKMQTQEKSIIKFTKLNNWSTFYNNFSKNGLVEMYEEELEEFDTDGLIF